MAKRSRRGTKEEGPMLMAGMELILPAWLCGRENTSWCKVPAATYSLESAAEVWGEAEVYTASVYRTGQLLLQCVLPRRIQSQPKSLLQWTAELCTLPQQPRAESALAAPHLLHWHHPGSNPWTRFFVKQQVLSIWRALAHASGITSWKGNCRATCCHLLRESRISYSLFYGTM